MTSDQTFSWPIYVIASDAVLLRALAEHRSSAAGWRFAALDGVPEPEALVIIDIEEETLRAERLRALRARGFSGPALIVGEASSEELSEDEPVARPVRLGLLLDRIDAHVAGPGESHTYRLGPYLFDAAERELRMTDGDPVRLTELERKLLACLAEADGATVGRERLLERVWGYSAEIATHTVGTHIWRLRQKIETDDPASRFLVTEPGGYRLVLAPADASD